jgi:TonB-linked SusC/RagA family outer membrane protein
MGFKCIKSRGQTIALIAVLMLGGALSASAQNVTSSVKGLVESSLGRPIPGASVLLKNNQTNFVAGTDTDSAGMFRFTNVPPGESYSFTFTSVGFQEQTLSGYTIQQGSSLSIVVKMVETTSTLDQVVVIGYGTSKKKNVTGAVVSVSEEEISQRSPTNAFEAIQGQMSGVQITTSSGAPGDNASLRIRGVSTFDAGASPLYIVDGQPLDNIDNLNPNDISSIEVLKDGSSAAIYGSKSANGVVIVTTKSGKKGQSRINLNYLRSYTSARIMPVATTNGRLSYEKFHNIIGDRADVDTLNQQFYNNNNFQELMYRTAVKDQVNIGIMAGSEKTKLYWNTGFLNQEGVIRTTKFMRLNSRLNVDHSFNKVITIGTRSNLSYDVQTNIDPEFETDLIGVLLTKAPFSTIYDVDSSFLYNVNSYRGRQNPLFEYTSMDVKKRNLRGNVFNYVEAKLAKGLTYRANFGLNFHYSRNTSFFPSYVRSSDERIQSSFYSRMAWDWLHESFFNYDKSFGNHQISAVAGFSTQQWSAPEENIGGLLASNLIPTLNNATEILITNTYTRDEDNHSLASVFGRLSYNYDNKYLVAATIRRDGSSRFGPQNKWGNFPSLSVGWRFSQEGFMQHIPFINDAKLRAGFAVTGNERIGNRDYDPQLTNGNFYMGINGVGLSTRLANPAIQWEETRQTNVGLDVSLLNRKVNITVDYYRKKTVELLANQPLPAESGLTDVRVNLGDVQNQGFEFSIQATPWQSTNFVWRTNFNFSTNSNKVLRLAGDVPIVSSNYITREGSPLGSFYGYTMLGIFPYDQSNAYSPDGRQLTANFDAGGTFTGYTQDGKNYDGEVKQISVAGVVAKGGDFQWLDNNGDFRIDEADRLILGNPYPRYFGGFRNEVGFKNFTFSFLFDYQFDVQVYNAFMQNLAQLKDNAPTPPPYVLDNFWEGPGDMTALFPGGTRRVQNQLGGSAPTSYWVEDADFIKLRNVKLSYNIPTSFTSRWKITELTVYGAVNNALVWTNYRGFDPEVNLTGSPLTAGQDNARYPRGREYVLGLNVNF